MRQASLRLYGRNLQRAPNRTWKIYFTKALVLHFASLTNQSLRGSLKNKNQLSIANLITVTILLRIAQEPLSVVFSPRRCVPGTYAWSPLNVDTAKGNTVMIAIGVSLGPHVLGTPLKKN